MTTSVKDRIGLVDIDEDHLDSLEAETDQKRMFNELVQQAISKYHRALDVTDSITERDFEEFKQYNESESAWNAAGAHTYSERIQMIRESIDKWIPEMIREHLSIESKFYGDLSKAVRLKWISEESAKDWEQRLKSKNYQHWEKAKFLKEEFPKFLKNWEEVAKDRKDVIDLSKKLGVSANALPELQELLNDKTFLSLHYHTRVHKVSKIKALLLAKEKQKEQFLQFIEKELESWAHAGWIHSSKVGPWMRRVMESEHPETFASKILYPFKKNWQVARERFDEVGPALKKRKDIRGFTPLKAQAFLLLDYDQRIAYLDEAESRLESDINEEGKLAALRLDIRHAMDTGDWEGAEELLGVAQGMAPDDKAVRSMGRYLATHRTDILEQDADETIIHLQQKGMTALTELQAIMQKIPTNMRVLTEKALHSSNPNTIKRLWQVFYNRHWVIAHGYSSAQQDQMESFKEENYEETEESLANGHGWGFIRRTIKDDTANDAAIRDECVKPQVLYTNGSGLTEVYEGIERNADNATFGYWTTLIDDEVPYDSLREAVLNHMYHIKKNAKILRELGIRYTSYGTPFSLN